MEKQKPNCPAVAVDSRGFVSIDGVRLGRLIRSTQTIQVVDKDRRRSEARGSRFVEVKISDLSKLVE
jgi:hypothetical protein